MKRDFVNMYFEFGRLLLACVVSVIAGAYLFFDINVIGLLMDL